MGQHTAIGLVFACALLGCTESSFSDIKADDTATVGTPPPASTTSVTTPATETSDTTAPPIVVSVRIVPESVFEDSRVECQATVASGSTASVGWTWDWTVDGLPAGDAIPTLDSAWFDKDQTLRCYATPRDGEPGESEAVRVRNTPPAQTRPTIAPNPARIGDDVRCEASPPTDIDPPDAGRLTTTTTWRVDGVDVARGATLATAGLSAGASVVCEVLPKDPDEAGVPATSAPVVLDCDPGTAVCPGLDCADLLAQGVTTDGWYWIAPPCAEPLEAWCDQTTDGGGWTRVRGDDYATDGCPAPWAAHPDYALCLRSDGGDLAQSVFTATWCIDYAEVRARLVGYQSGSMDGFGDDAPVDLEAIYGDGLSLTVGDAGARSHLFTWAVGFGSADADDSNCPSGPGGDLPPAFVDEAFTCETGNPGPEGPSGWYPDTPLFAETWAQVPGATGGDLEARLMASGGALDEDLGVGALMLYVR